MITRVGITKKFIENKLWWEGPEFLKLKKEQMFEFSIPESNFDTEVRKTSSTCLNANAEKLSCNMHVMHANMHACNMQLPLGFTVLFVILEGLKHRKLLTSQF